jgi:hypothetical protein
MSITLKAKFDGEKILLLEPYPLEVGAELIITIPENEDEERRIWLEASQIQLAELYDEDEPEFPHSLIKKHNSKYDGK